MKSPCWVLWRSWFCHVDNYFTTWISHAGFCGVPGFVMWITILQHEIPMGKMGVAPPPFFLLCSWHQHDFHKSPCPSIPQAYPTQNPRFMWIAKNSCCSPTHPTWWPHEGLRFHMAFPWLKHPFCMENLHVDLMWKCPAGQKVTHPLKYGEKGGPETKCQRIITHLCKLSLLLSDETRRVQKFHICICINIGSQKGFKQ